MLDADTLAVLCPINRVLVDSPNRRKERDRLEHQLVVRVNEGSLVY